MITSPSVNGPFPESTLYSYSDNAWKQYQYYATALHYDEMQNTTLTIGTGSIYSFEGEGRAKYLDAPLEAGTSYRVFIRLYSSVSDTVRREREGEEERGGEDGKVRKKKIIFKINLKLLFLGKSVPR